MSRARDRATAAALLAALGLAGCAAPDDPPVAVAAPAGRTGPSDAHVIARLRAEQVAEAVERASRQRERRALRREQREAAARAREAAAVTPASIATPGGPPQDVWDRLAFCESTGHWDYGRPGGYSDGDGYEGGLNFAPGTWDSYAPDGYPSAAYDATREQQIVVAIRVRDGVPAEHLSAQGWGAWPACSAKLGL